MSCCYAWRMKIRRCVCAWVCACVCVCACVRVCVCACVRAYVRAYVRASERACVRVCVCACVCFTAALALTGPVVRFSISKARRRYLCNSWHMFLGTRLPPPSPSASSHAFPSVAEWIALSTNRIRAPTETFDEAPPEADGLFYDPNMLLQPGSAGRY